MTALFGLAMVASFVIAYFIYRYANKNWEGPSRLLLYLLSLLFVFIGSFLLFLFVFILLH